MKQLLVNPWLLALWITLPVILPYFHPYFFPVHDETHGARIVEMTQALRDGHIPPRWSPTLAFGYGMPLFSFYPPLPYFLGSLFTLVGLPVLASVKLLFMLTAYFSFIVMYFLARDVWNKQAGILSGVLFIYIPYRAVNMYARGALAELLGISL